MFDIKSMIAFVTYSPMTSNMYSIIRFVGKDAKDWVNLKCEKDCSGMYAYHKLKDNDYILWFSYSSEDFGKHVTPEFVLLELERLGKGVTYDAEDRGVRTQVLNTRISGTVICHQHPYSY